MTLVLAFSQLPLEIRTSNIATRERASRRKGVPKAPRKPNSKFKLSRGVHTTTMSDNLRQEILWRLTRESWASRTQKSIGVVIQCTLRRQNTKVKQPISRTRIPTEQMSVTSNMNNMNNMNMKMLRNNTMWCLDNLISHTNSSNPQLKVRDPTPVAEAFNRRVRLYHLDKLATRISLNSKFSSRERNKLSINKFFRSKCSNKSLLSDSSKLPLLYNSNSNNNSKSNNSSNSRDRAVRNPKPPATTPNRLEEPKVGNLMLKRNPTLLH